MSKRLFLLITLALGVLAVAMWVAAIKGPLNPDAGYYLSIARHVADGKVPYRDLPTPYAPGAFYVFSVLGDTGLSNAIGSKILLYLIHALNTLFVFLILLSLGHRRSLSAFLSLIFALWIYGSDGTAIVLEPIQNFFILLSLLAVLKFPNTFGAVLGGLLVGLSLLSKQHSLLSVPFVAAIAAAPWWINQTAYEFVSKRSWWWRGGIFTASVSVPFLLFCLLTEQNFVETFQHIATFGGGAIEYGRREFYSVFPILTTSSNGYRILIPFLIVAIWAIFLNPRRGNIVFLGALIANFLPIIFVRGYGHYLQLVAPWAIIIAAEFCRTTGERFADSQSGERIIATAISLPIVPLLMLNAYQALWNFERDMMAQQSAFAREIAGRLPEKDNVLIINATWLYFLANVNPPKLDYRFVQRPEDDQGILDATAYTVLMPFRRFDQNEARQWLEREQFIVFDTLEWLGQPVYLLRR